MNDLNELVIKGATDALKDVVKDITKSAAKFAQREYKKLLLDFEGGFGSFLERNFRRISRIKTLLNPSTPISLEVSYVAPNLGCGDRMISERDFFSQLPSNPFVVVTGIISMDERLKLSSERQKTLMSTALLKKRLDSG
jgi:hypothetical protein